MQLQSDAAPQRSTNATSQIALSGMLLASLALAVPMNASENVARKPFAQWAELPEPGQFVVTPWYMEAEAYHIWANGNQRYDANVIKDGEDYGVDSMNGIISLQYALDKYWAFDLEVGVGTVGSRAFNSNHEIQSTTGIMDTTFGVRYQICKEDLKKSKWTPTLTFRAAGILLGSYDPDVPFAPGNHSTAIEPSIMFQKHFGWTGFGGYGDIFYRWMRTSGDDQYAVAVGFLQDIQRWRLNVGYRHFQCLSGYDFDPSTCVYSPQIREISDAIEAGFSYTTEKRHWNWAFHMRKILDGSNTASSLWFGVFVDIPFGGKPAEEVPASQAK